MYLLNCLLDHLGTILGSSWGHLGTMLGSSWAAVQGPLGGEAAGGIESSVFMLTSIYINK